MTKRLGRLPNSFVSGARARRRRVYNNPPAEIILSAFAPYIVGAIAIWYFTRKAKSELPEKIEAVKTAAAQIKTNLPGAASDWLFGVNDSTYVSPAQAKINDAAALALARSKAGLGGLSPTVYGA